MAEGITHSSFTPKQIEELLKTGKAMGRPDSPHLALWASLNFPAIKEGQLITLGPEYKDAIGYLRMKLSRFSQDTGAMFKTRKLIDESLTILCLVPPDLAKLGVVAAEPTIPVIPSIVYQPELNLIPVVGDTVAEVLSAIKEAVVTHPTREELHNWLKGINVKGWTFIYIEGRDGDTPAALVEEWANQVDTIAAAAVGIIVEMEYVD